MAGSVSFPEPRDSRLVGRLVLGLDERLRRAQHLFEYSDDPECLFRIGRTPAARPFTLSDGSAVDAGDPLIELHFWNQHIFARTDRADLFAWGARMRRAFLFSLKELSEFLDRSEEYDDIVAIFGNLGVAVAARSDQLRRVCRIYGFEPVLDGHRPSGAEHLHRAGQNMLGLLLTLAVNPRSARLDVLARDRTPVAISRAELRRRYGGERPAEAR